MILTSNDFRLEAEHGGFVNVYCKHCQEHVGRVQARSSADTEEQGERWEAMVQGEIDLMIKEHQTLCCPPDPPTSP